MNILMQTWPSSVHIAIHEKRITLTHSAIAFLYIGQGHCTAATVTRRRPPEESCNMPAQTLASVSQGLPQRTALFSKLTQMVNGVLEQSLIQFLLLFSVERFAVCKTKNYPLLLYVDIYQICDSISVKPQGGNPLM